VWAKLTTNAKEIEDAVSDLTLDLRSESGRHQGEESYR
jgi:hypothetical protein